VAFCNDNVILCPRQIVVAVEIVFPGAGTAHVNDGNPLNSSAPISVEKPPFM